MGAFDAVGLGVPGGWWGGLGVRGVCFNDAMAGPCYAQTPVTQAPALPLLQVPAAAGPYTTVAGQAGMGVRGVCAGAGGMLGDHPCAFAALAAFGVDAGLLPPYQ